MTREQYIYYNALYNLFWTRVFKEQCVLLASSVSCQNMRLIQSLDRYKVHYEMLLAQTIEAGLSVFEEKERSCGMFLSKYTLECEKKTQELSGTSINYKITMLEQEQLSKPTPIGPGKLPNIYEKHKKLGAMAVELTDGFCTLLKDMKKEIQALKLYCGAYLSYLDIVISQAQEYIKLLKDCDRGQLSVMSLEYKAGLLRSYAEFTRGALDPSETNFISQANAFAAGFAHIECKADNAPELTELCQDFSMFLAAITEGVISGKVFSVFLPITADMFYRNSLFFALDNPN